MPRANPSAVKVPTSQNYMSIYDIHKPEVSPDYFDAIKNDLLLLDLQELLGMSKPVSNISYKHYESDHVFSYITAKANVADPGAGNDATMTLATADHVDSGTKSYPRVNDIWQLQNGVNVKITAKSEATPNAHTITMEPLVTAENIGAITLGDTLFHVSNMWGEGTDQPEGLTPRPIEYENTLQIIKDTFEVTGTEMGMRAWFYVPARDGYPGGWLWYYEGLRQTAHRFKVYHEVNALLTPTTDNTALTAVGDRSSQGLFPFIEENGGIVDTYSAGGWNLSRTETILKNLTRAYGNASEFYEFGGFDYLKETNRWKRDLFGTQGAIQYGAFNGNKDISVALGFESINHLGFTIHTRHYKLFDNPRQMGTPGFKYPGYAFMIPAGMTVDGKGKETTYMRKRYLAADGYSREFEEWPTGGANGVYTNQTDSNQFNFRSECGQEWFGPEQFVLIKEV